MVATLRYISEDLFYDLNSNKKKAPEQQPTVLQGTEANNIIFNAIFLLTFCHF